MLSCTEYINLIIYKKKTIIRIYNPSIKSCKNKVNIIFKYLPKLYSSFITFSNNVDIKLI